MRATSRAARRAMTTDDRAEQAAGLSRSIMAFLTGGDTAAEALDGADELAGQRGTVAAYLGVDPEPDTRSLLSALHLAGFDVVVPVCEPGRDLSWVTWWPGVPVVRSVHAPVDEPTGRRRPFEDVHEVRILLVPALGVDTTGARIGQGGGYYDRFLARYSPAARGGVPAMALVYRSEVAAAGSVPVGPLDEPLTGAFTADGAVLFGPAPHAV